MRTTVRLQDGLLRRAKKYAAAHGKTLTSVLEEGVSLVLSKHHRSSSGKKPFRLTAFGKGGLLPGIDPASNAALFDILDREDAAGGR